MSPPGDRRSSLESAATVVVLRDASPGLEVLMVRRTTRLAFAAGHWVFPGGRIEDADRAALGSDDELGAARRAAVRETAEETAVALSPEAMVWFAHWTPPPTAPRRYTTYFFAAAARRPDLTVTVDGAETDAWMWVAPGEAISARDRGEVELRPATWITLHTLRRFSCAADALEMLGRGPVEYFETRLAANCARPTALYRGDAGYETADATSAGPRHRLVMGDGPWRYQRDDLTVPGPPE